MDNHDIMQTALQQSAYDCSCRPEDFQSAENSVHESVVTDRARRYLKLPHICNLVSYGTNIVAAVQTSILPDMERFINRVPDIGDCFETPWLYSLNQILKKADASICFMADYYLPDIDAVYRLKRNCPYELRVLEPQEFADCYTQEWKNALCKERMALDVLAVGAYDKGHLIGLAGCSADCDTMWQIGVDVRIEYRRQGVASALTNRLARETFERGYVPFYCAAWSNVKSRKNAVRSGFRPGWVEAAAKSSTYIHDIIKKS